MSQDENTSRPEFADTPVTPTQATGEHLTSTAPAAGHADETSAPTIGTGTSIALGCVAGTVLLIGIGLIYLLILAIF